MSETAGENASGPYATAKKAAPGPRICIGKYFALLEATLVVAEVAQRYRLQLVPGQQIDTEWAGTLRPSRNIMMTPHPRP
jgi:cytochrome P450